MMDTKKDLYELAGGDAAWQMWFDLCSVGRVQERNPGFAEGLAREIDSAMCSQLARFGYPLADMNGDVPVAHFDSYFKADSDRKEAEGRKPLKQHLKYRMALNDRPMKDVVVGTLFGSGCGYIHDIVRDWVASVRGWKLHSVRQADGKRHLVWESAAEGEDVREEERGTAYTIGNRLDRNVLAKIVEDVLSEVSEEIGVEKAQMASLLYVTAHDISITRQAVLDSLGVKKSMAYKLQNKSIKAMETILKAKEIDMDDLEFGNILLSACERAMGSELLASLQQNEVSK